MLIRQLPPTASLWGEVAAERDKAERERRERKLADRERHYQKR